MGSEQSVASEKQQARQQAKRRRDMLGCDHGQAGGLDIDSVIAFLHKLAGGLNGPVAGYWPIASEFETRDLMARLHAGGAECCLPVVAGPAQPLIFRKWTPGTVLKAGAFDVSVPPEDAEVMVPAVVLTPLLAFDARGFRLGYGGGFYDRTLGALRRHDRIFAVGMAYSGQQVDKLPTDAYDQPLDAVITERYSRIFT